MNENKHAWVERIGDECRANDIPFFLEFVGYEEGADEKGLDYAKKKPHIVTESMREFSKAALRRRRAQSRSAGEHEVRRGHEIVRRHEGLHARKKPSTCSTKLPRLRPSRSFIFRLE